MEVMTTLERQIQRNRRLLDNDPNNVDLMLTYALDCLRRDLRFEALVTFQKALRQKETAEARLALAKIFYLQSLYRESYDELRRLFQIDYINIEGHALLHLLNDKESAPADLAPRLAFVPSRAALGDELINARNERDLYRREVQEYEAIAAGVSDPEPILLYCLKEAQKRAERVNEYLEIMNGWEPLAIDMPGFLPTDSASVQPMEDIPEVKSEETVPEVAQIQEAGAAAHDEQEVEEVHSKRSKKSKRKRNKENRHNQAQAAETVEQERKEEIQAASETVEVESAEHPEAVSEVELTVMDGEKATDSEIQAEPVANVEDVENVDVVTAETDSEKSDIVASTDVEVPDVEVPIAETINEAVEAEVGTVSEASEMVEAAVEVVESAQAEAEASIPSEEELATEALFAEPLANMCRIKGNVRAIIFTARGRLVVAEGEFENAESVAVRAADCFKVMSYGAQNRLASLVSESKTCSIVMQQINDSYYMLVDGRAITLGVLRQRVERCRTELAGLC